MWPEMKSLRVSRSLTKAHTGSTEGAHTETHHSPAAKSEREVLRAARDKPRALLQGSDAPNESKFLIRNSAANGGRGRGSPCTELARSREVPLLRQTLRLVPEGKPEFLCDSTPPLVGLHPKELETGAQTNACARRVRTAKTRKQPECLSTERGTSGGGAHTRLTVQPQRGVKHSHTL